MIVYMILFDWSTTDCSDVEVELFDTFEKAKQRFFEIIENEKNPEMSWVAVQALDENGNIDASFEFDSNIDDEGARYLWWNITNKNDWYQHDFLSLKQIEVK